MLFYSIIVLLALNFLVYAFIELNPVVIGINLFSCGGMVLLAGYLQFKNQH